MFKLSDLRMPPLKLKIRNEELRILSRKLAPEFPYAAIDLAHDLRRWDDLIAIVKGSYLNMETVEDTFRTVLGAALERYVSPGDMITFVAQDLNPNGCK